MCESGKEFNPWKKGIRLGKIHIYTVWCVRARSCLTLCDPVGCNPQVSPGREILQARILEWAVMPSLRGSSPPRDRTHMSVAPTLSVDSVLLSPWAGPCSVILGSKSTLHCIAGSHGCGHLSFAVEHADDSLQEEKAFLLESGTLPFLLDPQLPSGCVWHSVAFTLELFDASSGLLFSVCQLLPAGRLVEDFLLAVLDHTCVHASVGCLAFQQEDLGLSVPVCSSLFINLRLPAVQRGS